MNGSCFKSSVLVYKPLLDCSNDSHYLYICAFEDALHNDMKILLFLSHASVLCIGAPRPHPLINEKEGVACETILFAQDESFP